MKKYNIVFCRMQEVVINIEAQSMREAKEIIKDGTYEESDIHLNGEVSMINTIEEVKRD